MLKPYLILIAMVFSLGNSSCRSAGLGVKVYNHQVERGGMYRGQDNELVPYEQANGWFCMNPDDFRKVVDFIDSCRGSK